MKIQRSTSEYFFKIASTSNSLSSKIQNIFFNSSFEAQYIAFCEYCRETVRLLRQVGFRFKPWDLFPSTDVMGISQSGMNRAENESIDRQNKDAPITSRIKRDSVLKKIVALGYTATSETVADLMTKPFGRIKIEYFRETTEPLN